ncbi:hypothetical protein BGW80DRAFT_107373 [Lactifluus volemus]|nr:hypothetical protein BGW80DRAFT_107373 [Lactifluus volemus]
MLRVSQPETAPSQLEIASPCLVLLHEFSSYFLDQENSHLYTLASYMSLVAHALTTLSSLSEQMSPSQVSLVLIDSRLDSLSLPVWLHMDHRRIVADRLYYSLFLPFHTLLGLPLSLFTIFW